MASPIQRGVVRLKQFAMRWASGTIGRFAELLGRTRYDYSSEVGDGRLNTIIGAAVGWVQRNFPDAPIQLAKVISDEESEIVRNHPMLLRVRHPNKHYAGGALWSATLWDYLLDGNAYWLKVRSAAGKVVELWYAPHWTMAPVWPRNDDTVFIDHYEYSPGNGASYPLDVKDVVHFRNGIDPKNTRRGLSRLHALARELFTDDEAANFVATMMRNGPVPSTIIMPKGENTITVPSATAIRDDMAQRFTGDGRGQSMILRAAVDVVPLSFKPSEINAREIRRIPEERITAVIGIPAVVAGLGAGLDRSCVPSYVRVQTPDGPRPIGEIAAGDVVWSFRDGRITQEVVSHKWAAGRDLVYEVRTRTHTVRATDNHPFMVRVAGQSGGAPNDARHASYEWRLLRDLRPGDYVIQAMAYPDDDGSLLPDGTDATVDMLRFLGAIVGDGTVSTAGVRMSMPSTDRCAPFYREAATRLFGKYASGGERPWRMASDGNTIEILERVQGGDSYHQVGRDLGLNSATVRSRYLSATAEPKPLVMAPILVRQHERYFQFSSAIWSRKLAAWGFAGRAHTKRVPGWVFSLSRDLRLAMLAGIVDSDGTVDARGVFSLTFCNRDLVEDVRDLAISCGLRPSLALQIDTPKAALPNPGTHEMYRAWRFTISSGIAAVPFIDPLYRARVELDQRRPRRHGFDAARAGLSDDLGFERILDITEVGEDDVFDLTVERGHSFFAEHTLVSNTYNNYGEAKAEGYEGTIIPMHRVFAEELHLQLLPDFESNTDLWLVEWDYAKVRALMEDADAVAARAVKLVGGPVALLNEGRSMVGLPPFEQGDFMYVPATVAMTPEVELFAPPEESSAPGEEFPLEEDTSLWYEDDAEVIDWPSPISLKVAGGLHAALLRYREAEYPRSTNALARMFARLRTETITRFEEVAKQQDVGDVVLLSERSEWADRLEMRLTNLFDDEIRKSLTREHTRFLLGVQQVVSVAFETEIPIDDQARTAFLQTAGEQIVGISKRTLRQVRLALQEGIAAGEDVTQIANRLKRLAAFSRSRAKTVARTEVGQATNEASLLTFALSGIVDEIVVHDGTEHDSICANLNGKRMTLAEARLIPRLAHPNCLIGDTEVVAPNLRASFVRWFDGEVIVLKTAEHDLLTCTPNHPVLTDRGWVAAGLLGQGDHVVRSLDSERIAALLDPYHDHRPAVIEEVANTLGPACGGTTATMPSAPEDFHGDGTDGDVYVVRTNRRGEMADDEPLGQRPVKWTDVIEPVLNGQRPPRQLINRADGATDGSVRSGSVRSTLLGADPFITEPLRLGAATNEVVGREPAPDLRRARVQDRPDLLAAQPLRDVQVLQSRDAREGPLSSGEPSLEAVLFELADDGRCSDAGDISDLLDRLSGLVASVQIVNVERRQFSGHVYNLETDQGWYVANRIITHNCVRSFAPVVRVNVPNVARNGHPATGVSV